MLFQLKKEYKNNHIQLKTCFILWTNPIKSLQKKEIVFCL